MSSQLPIRDAKAILEAASELYFKQQLPPEWLTDKPKDFGIDLQVGLVKNNQVTGLNFVVQLKATKALKSSPKVTLKTSTLHFLFNRLEPVMVVLYVQNENVAYWKWLQKEQFDLSKNQSSHTVHIDAHQQLASMDWGQLYHDVQRIFKIQKQLLTALEYDLFSRSELEAKAWAHYFQRNLPEAGFYFRRILAQEISPLILLALAQCEYDQFHYSQALFYINQALELEQSPKILATKGIILAEDGIQSKDYYKLKQAEAIFEILYVQNPSAIHAYNYANTLSQLNQLEPSEAIFTKAEALYKRTIELDPGFAEAWKNLGQLYFDMGQHQKEIVCYEKALEINPQLPEAHISKGITLTHVYHQHEDALKEMTSGIALDGRIFTRFPLIYYWMGQAHFALKEIPAALDWVNKGLNHHPGQGAFHQLKTRVLITHLDDPHILPEAIRFFTEGRELHPNDPLHFYYWCLSQLKAQNEATVMQELETWLQKQLSIKIHKSWFGNFSVHDLLVIPKYWDDTILYLQAYDLEAAAEHLKGLEQVDRFLDYFQLARALFLSLLRQQSNQPDTTKAIIDHCIQQAFYPLPVDSMAAMITATKEKPKELAHQLSIVLVHVSTLHLLEIIQCVGFYFGSLETPSSKFEHLIDAEAIHKELMLNGTEILYKVLG